jgi:hypothetical protein
MAHQNLPIDLIIPIDLIMCCPETPIEILEIIFELLLFRENLALLPKPKLTEFIRGLSYEAITKLVLEGNLACSALLIHEIVSEWHNIYEFDNSEEEIEKLLLRLKLDVIDPVIFALGELNTSYKGYRLVTEDEVRTLKFKDLFYDEYLRLNGIRSLDCFVLDFVHCKSRFGGSRNLEILVPNNLIRGLNTICQEDEIVRLRTTSWFDCDYTRNNMSTITISNKTQFSKTKTRTSPVVESINNRSPNSSDGGIFVRDLLVYSQFKKID